MTAQRRFDVDPQASLFDDEERDQLDAIAAQASTEDRDAWSELGKWARS